LAATAISALDAALWDVKAKLLGLPLAALLGRARTRVPIYGSGGFTSYDDAQLARQLADWIGRDGCRAVKMKIGSDPQDDPRRVRVAKEAIGEASLFVDANGAYSVKKSLRLAEIFAAQADVAWFEEPVSSDDLDGLARVRAAAPACMDIAAGEYAYNCDDVRRMLSSRAVDVQQVDASRCLGITGFLQAGAFAMRITSISPGIARPRYICMRPVPFRDCVIWNGSTTTCGLNTCCSMVLRTQKTVSLSPIWAALG
jgi:L-alanine-DL-glutamate epimerase-like enolase superfamily enzyme